MAVTLTPMTAQTTSVKLNSRAIEAANGEPGDSGELAAKRDWLINRCPDTPPARLPVFARALGARGYRRPRGLPGAPEAAEA